jgi:hypothetical protein
VHIVHGVADRDSFWRGWFECQESCCVTGREQDQNNCGDAVEEGSAHQISLPLRFDMRAESLPLSWPEQAANSKHDFNEV